MHDEGKNLSESKKMSKFRSCASLHDRIFFIFAVGQKLVLGFAVNFSVNLTVVGGCRPSGVPSRKHFLRALF